MESITLPDKYSVEKIDKAKAVITIEPCYPGYGTTLGNALRRVLLSSLGGAAVTAVKIKGITHEFSSLPGVKEDVVEIILNLKKLRLKVHSDDEVTVQLKAKGNQKVTGEDIKSSSDVEVINTDLHIATLTEKDAEIEMELTVKRGRGYMPVESNEKKKFPLGTIGIDAIFTPVVNVNYDTENVRVGKMTNYDRLIMTVATDGTTTPEEALVKASEILVDHFSAINTLPGQETNKEERKTAPAEDKAEKTDEKKGEKEEKDGSKKKKKSRPKKESKE